MSFRRKDCNSRGNGIAHSSRDWSHIPPLPSSSGRRIMNHPKDPFATRAGRTGRTAVTAQLDRSGRFLDMTRSCRATGTTCLTERGAAPDHPKIDSSPCRPAPAQRTNGGAQRTHGEAKDQRRGGPHSRATPAAVAAKRISPILPATSRRHRSHRAGKRIRHWRLPSCPAWRGRRPPRVDRRLSGTVQGWRLV